MRILLLLILILLYSCSEQAGGTGTETTNGFVTLSDGSPAVGAIVRVRKSSQWYDAVLQGEATLLDSVLCDENGYYDFGTLYDESHIFEICHGDESLLEALSKTDTFHLKPGVELSGAVPAGVTSVLLGGSDYTTAVIADSFHFAPVPLGYYPLFYKKGNELMLSGGVHLDQHESTVNILEHGGLLFNDYVGGFERSPLDYLSTSLYWYTFTDSCSKSYKDGAWKLKNLSEHGGKSQLTTTIEDGVFHLTALLKMSGRTLLPVSERSC